MKTKFNQILTAIFLLFGMVAFAQQTISGSVTDESGVPLPGATVVVQGTSNAAVTDFDGNFSINAEVGDTLEASYVGYSPNAQVVNSATQDFVLSQSNELDEVVITAQGITRDKKSLGYAVSTLRSEDVQSKPSTDLARALTGKAAGVNIRQTSGLSGTGTNIIIRGYSSINGSNQPLFIVDGIPFNSDTNGDRSFVTGGATASSRFLDIDPNNIKEVNILKGLSATTLYGQEGRNGVVLITTKTGSSSESSKKFEATLNTSYYVNEVANLPEYQNTYGNGFYQNYSAAFSNWGPSFDTRGSNGVAADGTVKHWYNRDNLSDVFPEYQGVRIPYRAYNSVEQFFTSGTISTTSLNVSQSYDKGNISMNFGHTDDTGFVETNNYKRLNLSVGGRAELSNNLTFDSSFNFTSTDRKTPPASIGFGSNPEGASLFANILYTPRSVDLFGMPFESPIDNSAIYYRSGNDIVNPRWTLKNALDTESVRRFFGRSSLSFKANDWLKLGYRATLDSYTQTQVRKINKGGDQVPGGQMITSNRLNTIWSHLISADINTDITDEISMSSQLGLTSSRETRDFSFMSSSEQFIYGLLRHGNFEEHDTGSSTFESNILGAYFSTTFDYNGYLFLNVQGRNDWFSSLQPDNRTIFYPATSLSFIPSEAIASIKASNIIDYMKVRLGYGSSAGFPSVYSTVVGLGSSTNVFINPADASVLNTLSISNRLGNLDLKPELIEELEFGLELQLFDRRVGVDLSIYDKVSSDLILTSKQLDPATGYTVTATNIAEVSNKGVELGLNLVPVKWNDLRWDINTQFTKNKNIVESLGGDSEQEVIAGYTNLGNFAIPGESYGVIQGSSIERDGNGNYVVGDDGNYLNNTDLSIIADPNPDWTATVINGISYKNLRFNMQWEYVKGGDMYSITAAALLSRGLTKDTEFDRTQGFVLPGVKQNGEINDLVIGATDYGFVNSGFYIDEQAVYDATNIRLREVSLTYDFPQSLLEATPFGRASISFVGENLFFKAINFPKYLNFDPEVNSLGVGNGSGFDYLTGPTAKKYGVNLVLTF
jgi:TonB-linked SusC/RagA family outer membrane protein